MSRRKLLLKGPAEGGKIKAGELGPTAKLNEHFTTDEMAL
tara:strand:- start:128 stop:247 length:120 start_codon:yes stop_codon:yes gene_type:complete